jgi:hypothetical protein
MDRSTNSSSQPSKNSAPQSQLRTAAAWSSDLLHGNHALCGGPNLLERVGLPAVNEDEAFEQLLSELREFRQTPAEPTPDCLSDVETLNFGQDEPLAPSRLSHIEQCRWCQSMLVGVIHTGDGFWQELRRRQAEAAARTNMAMGAE